MAKSTVKAPKVKSLKNVENYVKRIEAKKKKESAKKAEKLKIQNLLKKAAALKAKK